jgi:hypothetical protein
MMRRMWITVVTSSSVKDQVRMFERQLQEHFTSEDTEDDEQLFVVLRALCDLCDLYGLD